MENKKGVIVHIIPRGYVEGRAYQENILPRKHSELGYETHIITSQMTFALTSRDQTIVNTRNYVNNGGVYVHVLRATNKWIRYIKGISCVGLYKMLSEITPNIIFIHGVSSGENKIIKKYVKKFSDVVVYADCHRDYYNAPEKTIKQKIEGFMSRRYAKVLENIVEKFWGTTPWRVDYLRDYYHLPPSKIDLLIMGGDEKVIKDFDYRKGYKDIRDKYNIPEDAFLVITGGVIDKRKHQDLLMDAVSQLKEKNVWLLLFGMPTEEMKPICEEYKEKDNIIFAGWVDADYSNQLLLVADLAVYPGTHSVLWEQGAACGLPQIVRHWSGMEHINVNGNALLVDNVNIESLKNEIEKLVFTEEYYKMKTKAKEAAPNFYYIEIAKKSIELI